VFQFRKFLIIPFLLIAISQIRAEESPISTPEISEDMLKQSREIMDSVRKSQDSSQYQDHKKWIGENSQKLFARQAEKLPTIDYGITEKQLEKDAIATLLRKYRFKSDDIQKAQINHFPLMIFVSSSIPESSLKDLMIQAKKSGAVLVFRGMIGSFGNTAKYLANISKENVQAIIDPRLFDLFDVQIVPTIIVLKNINQDCWGSPQSGAVAVHREQHNCQITPIHDQISGNITLNYALETIAGGNGEASEVAAKFLTKIKQGGKNENL
jgi:type-F conjugative transfer system pilin assembly protein TrbC